MNDLLDRLCWWLVKTFPTRTRVIENYGEEYLLRFYIKHNGFFPGIYLHRFFRGDQDRELHNHPWLWSFSFILTGGYIEERLTRKGEIRFKNRKPFTFNLLTGNTFHRVDLVDKASGAWTLFCSGKEIKDWGFLVEGQFVPHKEYLENR